MRIAFSSLSKRQKAFENRAVCYALRRSPSFLGFIRATAKTKFRNSENFKKDKATTMNPMRRSAIHAACRNSWRSLFMGVAQFIVRMADFQSALVN